MQFFQFIFLKRSWEADKGVLTKTMNRLANSKEPLWLLIFPEGTVITNETRRRSKNYAEKSGLVSFQHCECVLAYCMEWDT